jgi:hypothetical protein
MKMAFIVHIEYYKTQVMKLLEDAGIDYYTSWDGAHGKGQGTEPHLGTGSFASTNSVMMIGFRDDGPLEALAQAITAANQVIKRPDDRIRLFQLPLERIV